MARPWPTRTASAAITARSTATSQASTTPSTPSEARGIVLKQVASWPVVDVATCADHNGSVARTVMRLTSFDLGCLRYFGFDDEAVFEVPYTSPGVEGQAWSDVTEPWKTVEGVEVRRLGDDSVLSRMSSRYVVGVADPAGNRMLIVFAYGYESAQSLLGSLTVSR